MEKLSLQALKAAFGKDPMPEIRVFERVDSTNSEAKRMANQGERFALIAACHQTAGRGRMGRSFYSPADTGVYFSLLFEPSGDLESAVTLTGAAAVCVMRAIRTLTGKQTAIKWVNDLYLDGKKVCGILCEAVTMGNEPPKLILGIGVNLCTAEFPDDLKDKAGSVNAQVSPNDLIAAVCRELMPYLNDPKNTAWLSDYRTHSCVIGRPIAWIEGEVTRHGLAEGINERGELLVRDEEGKDWVLRTGEISVQVESL